MRLGFVSGQFHFAKSVRVVLGTLFNWLCQSIWQKSGFTLVFLCGSGSLLLLSSKVFPNLVLGGRRPKTSACFDQICGDSRKRLTAHSQLLKYRPA